MVNWELVKDDPYYHARMMEERARKEGKPETWEEFADLKAQKGSYTLAVYGYINGAILYEQEGKAEQTFELYNKAFEVCRRVKYKEMAVIVTYRHALLAEQFENWNVCISVYERLGNFSEELGSYFLAADAYEHVAEIMAKTGQDVSTYEKPIELWERNAKYWAERGEEDDALWSQRHIALYKNLFGVKNDDRNAFPRT